MDMRFLHIYRILQPLHKCQYCNSRYLTTFLSALSTSLLILSFCHSMTLSISKYPRETNSTIQIKTSATSSCRLRSYTPRNPCLLTFDIDWINSAHSSDAIVRVKSSPLMCATLSNSKILLCGSFNNSTNLLISLYILFFSCNEFCIR